VEPLANQDKPGKCDCKIVIKEIEMSEKDVVEWC